MRGSDFDWLAGKRTQNFDPFLTFDCNPISLPWASTTAFTIPRPRPLPPAARDRAQSAR